MTQNELTFLDWRQNFVEGFKAATKNDDDFASLGALYPEAPKTREQCIQRKNNLLRSGNRSIYLDDIYVISKYTKRSPNSILLGQDNILSFWKNLQGENLFDEKTIEIITDAIKSDDSYKKILIPTLDYDFLYYAKNLIYEMNKNNIGSVIFNLSNNSLDFLTNKKTVYSYRAKTFNSGDVFDDFSDYLIMNSSVSKMLEKYEKNDIEMFAEAFIDYMDNGSGSVDNTNKSALKQIKNWVCNCTMWIALSYIGDLCKRNEYSLEKCISENSELIEFLFNLFIFGSKRVLQKRITDEKNPNKRIRYIGYLDCNNEKLEIFKDDEESKFYKKEDFKKGATIAEMQKSSLSSLLDFSSNLAF